VRDQLERQQRGARALHDPSDDQLAEERWHAIGAEAGQHQLMA
jgi:hypothetical protein